MVLERGGAMAIINNEELTVTVKIKFVTEISWLSALKLRLAGGEAIKELMETKVDEFNEKDLNDNPDVPMPNVPKPFGGYMGKQ